MVGWRWANGASAERAAMIPSVAREGPLNSARLSIARTVGRRWG